MATQLLGEIISVADSVPAFTHTLRAEVLIHSLYYSLYANYSLCQVSPYPHLPVWWEEEERRKGREEEGRRVSVLINSLSVSFLETNSGREGLGEQTQEGRAMIYGGAAGGCGAAYAMSARDLMLKATFVAATSGKEGNSGVFTQYHY